jgi:GntR family transcriptional regulator
MRLFLSKNSEVPLREQLVRQVILGITSGDLHTGQRMPSTRELARRFHIHSNTVSAAYRDLENRGWLELRKGSGVYVSHREPRLTETAPSSVELDGLISTFLSDARAHGFSLAEIQNGMKLWLDLGPPDHFLLVEPDEGLREILAREIEDRTGFHVRTSSLDSLQCSETSGAVVVAMTNHIEKVRAVLSPGTASLFLRSRSVPESLRGQKPPPVDALIAVVSRWPRFLEWARVVLVAAGLDSSSLSLHDAREDGWSRGLGASAFVVTDALTARLLPAGCEARVFNIIADSSLEELCRFVEKFLTHHS